jgi:hypothetical protein
VPPQRNLRAAAIHHRRRRRSVTPLPNAARGEDPFILLSLLVKLRQGFEPAALESTHSGDLRLILCPWSMVDQERCRSMSPWTWSLDFSFQE